MLSNDERSIQTTLNVDFVHDIAATANGKRVFLLVERENLIEVDSIDAETLTSQKARSSDEEEAAEEADDFFDGLEDD